MSDFHAYHAKATDLSNSVMTALGTQTRTINMRFKEVNDQLEGMHAFIRWQAAMIEEMKQQLDRAAAMQATAFTLIGAKLDVDSGVMKPVDLVGLVKELSDSSAAPTAPASEQPAEQITPQLPPYPEEDLLIAQPPPPQEEEMIPELPELEAVDREEPMEAAIADVDEHQPAQDIAEPVAEQPIMEETPLPVALDLPNEGTSGIHQDADVPAAEMLAAEERPKTSVGRRRARRV